MQSVERTLLLSATSIGDPRARGYRPGLATSELVAEIRGLLATERRAERLVCRYLADRAPRRRGKEADMAA